MNATAERLAARIVDIDEVAINTHRQLIEEREVSRLLRRQIAELRGQPVRPDYEVPNRVPPLTPDSDALPVRPDSDDEGEWAVAIGGRGPNGELLVAGSATEGGDDDEALRRGYAAWQAVGLRDAPPARIARRAIALPDAVREAVPDADESGSDSD